MRRAGEERQPIVWWHPVVSLAAVTGLDALIAIAESHGRTTHHLFGALMMGPFSGWLMMPSPAKIGFAWTLVSASFASVLPLAIYLARGALGGLVVGSIAWWSAGFLFSVAVGI